MSPWETVAVVAAPPPPPDDPGGQGADFGKSSPVGLILLILFFIAVIFLVRSMTKHLKRVPATFDEAEAPAQAKRAQSPEDVEPAGEASADAEAKPDGEKPA